MLIYNFKGQGTSESAPKKQNRHLPWAPSRRIQTTRRLDHYFLVIRMTKSQWPPLPARYLLRPPSTPSYLSKVSI
jgi:hypothetical protein